MATEDNFPRRPYTGSCHCGNIKYIVYLALPTAPDGVTIEQLKDGGGLRIYKCSCNTCQKMGIFHTRLRSAPDDFLLLSPTDPEAPDSGVTPYKVPHGHSKWWFCTHCGCRCFTTRAPSERSSASVPLDLLKKLNLAEDSGVGESRDVAVWKLKKAGYEEGGGRNYFSLNAVTLDQGQEGLDIGKWHENGWLKYIDSGDVWKVGEPYRGGMY